MKLKNLKLIINCINRYEHINTEQSFRKILSPSWEEPSVNVVTAQLLSGAHVPAPRERWR